MELLKLITVKDFEHFMDRPVSDIRGWDYQPVLVQAHPGMLEKKYQPGGLLFGEGEAWRTARHILSPTFSSFKMRTVCVKLFISCDKQWSTPFPDDSHYKGHFGDAVGGVSATSRL